MGNMSYCKATTPPDGPRPAELSSALVPSARFQNTLGDLLDCFDKLEELEGDIVLLSKEECEAAESLISLCGEIHYMYNEWKK